MGGRSLLRYVGVISIVSSRLSHAHCAESASAQVNIATCQFYVGPKFQSLDLFVLAAQQPQMHTSSSCSFQPALTSPFSRLNAVGLSAGPWQYSSRQSTHFAMNASWLQFLRISGAESCLGPMRHMMCSCWRCMHVKVDSPLTKEGGLSAKACHRKRPPEGASANYCIRPLNLPACLTVQTAPQTWNFYRPADSLSLAPVDTWSGAICAYRHRISGL